MCTGKILRVCPALLEGAGQVMFQKNRLAGLLFLCGIAWRAAESGTAVVLAGALVGLLVSTLAAYAFPSTRTDADSGLAGFNGILVGCALPSFIEPCAAMWLALIVSAGLSPFLRILMNRGMKGSGLNSLTFPFVLISWIVLAAFARLAPGSMLAAGSMAPCADGAALQSIAEGLLKSFSQVFLINSWVTGLFFLVGLALSSLRATAWAAAGAVLALVLSMPFTGPDSPMIVSGVFGFNAVLTGIALGSVFPAQSRASTALWCLCGIIVSLLIQAGLACVMAPPALPVFTAPFCFATWLVLLARKTAVRVSRTC